MKKLMMALTLTAAGLMAAQNSSAPAAPANGSTTAPAPKTTKVKKHRKNTKTPTPADPAASKVPAATAPPAK